MKPCIACGRTLPVAEFYPHPRMADGHLNKCKDCCKRQANERRRAKLQEIREYDRRRAQTSKRKEVASARQRRGRQLYPEKDKARDAVSRAVKAGKLTRQPCATCGAGKVEAHHPDYSRPLDVIWLCRNCHNKIHHG